MSKVIEGAIKISRCVRRECGECGEPATKYQGYLLPNARSNPASKGYRGDDISWCTDADAYFCDACHSPKGYAHKPPEGYTNGSTWTYSDQFMHMFFHYVEDKDAAAELSRLASQSERLRTVLKYCVREMSAAESKVNDPEAKTVSPFTNALCMAHVLLSSEAEQSDKPGETK